MYNSNQLYSRQGQTTIERVKGSEIIKGLSKLSLFKVVTSETTQFDEDQCFNLLLTQFNPNDTFYFRKIISDDLLIWDVFFNQALVDYRVRETISGSDFDFIFWPSKELKRPKLLVFDMDSTFIQIEVIDELARQHGVGDSVSTVTEAAMRGELDFSESLISRVACLKGLSHTAISDIANKLPLSKGVDKLVEQCKKEGVKIAIVSGGFMPFVQHLQNIMGLFKVKANELEVVSGLLTGKVVGDIVDAQAKADFVNQLKEKLNISRNEIMTIGDGANDLLMMKESGFSLAYRAKPAVQAEAKGRMNFTDLNHLINVLNYSCV